MKIALLLSTSRINLVHYSRAWIILGLSCRQITIVNVETFAQLWRIVQFKACLSVFGNFNAVSPPTESSNATKNKGTMQWTSISSPNTWLARMAPILPTPAWMPKAVDLKCVGYNSIERTSRAFQPAVANPEKIQDIAIMWALVVTNQKKKALMPQITIEAASSFRLPILFTSKIMMIFPGRFDNATRKDSR